MVFWCFVSVFRCFSVSWFSNAMTDGFAFFIANVKFSKHSHNCSNGMGIFMCMLNSINSSERKLQKYHCVYFEFNERHSKETQLKEG